MKYIYGILLLAFLLPAYAHADCIKTQDGSVVCGTGKCEMDSHGKVLCAEAGGGAIKDQYGNIQCGVGYCAEDDTRNVWCSKVRGGGAAKDSEGNVKCQGGCESGSEEYCHEGK